MVNKPKNIVVCLDGTGNQIEENLSNVLKLVRTLKNSNEQIVFYDQGVGTLGHKYTWGRTVQELKNLLGLGFGLGIDRNVLKGYEFIAEHYSEHKIGAKKKLTGDNIFIFGFSRGAHTARILAGLIYEIGIIRPEQIHLSGAALSAYKRAIPSNDKGYEGDSANFRRVVGTKTATITFLGVWDTVSSIFVPNSKGYWPPIVREKLPHTSHNPSVHTFRHAIAVDERRRMFRVDHWELDQQFKPNIYSQGKEKKQDAKEVWFSGFHSDVGGGHDRENSGLSQIPLIWMIEEAKASGLKVNDRMLRYVTGQKKWSATTKYIYPKPDVKAPVHNSMKGLWNVLEIIPKHTSRREWENKKSVFGCFLPLSEPRSISDETEIHPSVKDRIKIVPDYKPVNVID